MKGQSFLILCLSVLGVMGNCPPELMQMRLDGPIDDRMLECLFQHRNKFPEHEIVKIDVPERLHKRDLGHQTPLKFRALGMDIDLLLRPTDASFASDETPVYYARYSPQRANGVAYEEVVGAMKSVGRLLEDPQHLASVVLGSDRYGRTTINGYMRPDNKPLVIRSLPRRVVNRYLRNRRSIHGHSNDSASFAYHLVAKVNEDYLQGKSVKDLYRAAPRGNSTSRNKSYPSRRARSYQREFDPVYPQLIVQVDVTFQRDLAARGMSGFLEYLLAFWNAVDMVYRHVKYPPIRINIAAIVIARDLKATPYIAQNMLGTNRFSDKALLDAASYHFKMRNIAPFDNCDAVAIMTHFDMGWKGEPDGFLGLAYEDWLCKIDYDDELKWGNLLIQDYGSFIGIVGAAHEFGHLLGLHHDLEPPSVGCEKGFIMGAIPPARDASWLSKCSLDSMKRSYEAGRYACMYDKPVARGKELPRLIAGKIDDLTKQCAAMKYGPPYLPEDGSVDVCVEFYCYVTNERTQVIGTGMAAAPGTLCGSKTDSGRKVCLKSRCVSV